MRKYHTVKVKDYISNPMSDESLEIALRCFASGSISGQVSEWPQLKPALRWAVKEIDRLRKSLETNRK